MAKIKHDIWKSKEGLTSLCYSGELGEESRSILEPDSENIHSFYANSHFDAMTKYYEYMDWGVYETEFEIDKESYNLNEIETRARGWNNKNRNTEHKIKEFDDLFSMFHDFEIVGLKLDDSILNMEILLPWSEMWEIEDYKMTFRFDGCKTLKCHYWKRTSNELKEWEKGVYYPSEEHITTDPNQIVELELDVQSHDFNEPDNFVLHCNSSTSHGSQIGLIEFGRIELSVTDYQIFDNEMNEITLDKMKSWGTEWWDSIQKMWDEQKEKK